MTTIDCAPGVRVTRSLLGYGVLAGPFYVLVSLAQALTRDGFDPLGDAWSLLALGPHGWIQIGNLLLSGAMTVAMAAGLRRVLPGSPGPYLLAGYGLGQMATGVFVADPAHTTAPTWHGILHLVAGGIGFLCLTAACFVLARRVPRRLAWFSRLTGAYFLLAFAGLASGVSVLGFVVAVSLVAVWLAVLSIHHYRAA